jgi:hypothetical protein
MRKVLGLSKCRDYANGVPSGAVVQMIPDQSGLLFSAWWDSSAPTLAACLFTSAPPGRSRQRKTLPLICWRTRPTRQFCPAPQLLPAKVRHLPLTRSSLP